ncbi:DUF4446 family protein [Paenibacillus daejeonensis]|uniref:DUF4446 family protein n=1 Tax=Paenibacillus daejeonensis TaxID=135193 RepID=UPI000371BBA3|nr:DUF4446 family protein [Paenibacillus daejeonensis]
MEDITVYQIGGFFIAVTLFMLVVWNFVLTLKFNRVKKQYRRMMDGAGIDNLEGVLTDIQDRMAGLRDRQQLQESEIKAIAQAFGQFKGHVGFHRYNAFAEQGNDMSFSLALINAQQDGVVLSGLHSRDETYVYAKPLTGGESPYALTPEEKQAITLALQQS